MSIKVSGGGGGGASYPGVTADGLTPGGLTILGNLTAGDPNAAVTMPVQALNGAIQLVDTPATLVNGAPLVYVGQSNDIPAGGFGYAAIQVYRVGSIALTDYQQPVVTVTDTTASVEPVLQLTKQGTVVLEIATRKSITGALASVTDANAKAVLTSVIAALTGIKVANNNTT